MLDTLSVVIPTRNEAALMDRFLRSLPDEVELVVVDASDDETPALIERIRPHNTRIIRSSARIAEAREIGAAAASGEWLIFSDADVYFVPGYFERFGRYYDADAIYGPKYATADYRWYSTVFVAGQRLAHTLGFPAASGSNMAVRRQVLNAVGGFRCDLPVNEDSELFLRLAHRGHCVRFAPDLAVYSLDDRRLKRGAVRKLLHSITRCALIALGMRVPLPQRLLRHDWGYWSMTR
ncbi:glycosyltransferase [Caldichromatium japonicum]|uniref:Glycosyltransferase n=1 Tax=Caldichromatium japonicum TaxID=2699430 RepID=A0A6G7VG05_9GAMM|nr:glycosyltransferase [Caldichromatium japonicum]QIK38840.1 glycosyltransferase [Caldichromatium japonicum]